MIGVRPSSQVRQKDEGRIAKNGIDRSASIQWNSILGLGHDRSKGLIYCKL
jgi:hypothetical protein